MTREIRILHTADTHLGYKQYHSEARRNDFFAAFELVVNDAVEMQVDAVVHAGDLFDSRNPTLEDLLETMNILSRLKAADISFFGIVGNHESKQNTQWLDLFEEMGLAARLGKKPLIVGNAAIYGIDSVPKSKIPIFDYSGFEAPDSSPSTSSVSSTPSTLPSPSTSSISSVSSTPSTLPSPSTSSISSVSSLPSTLPSPSASSTSSVSSTPSTLPSPPASSTPPTLSTPSPPAENCWKLLVMHQIMSPFPYAEWDCDEVLENLPFRVDAVLLGDYHEHAIIKNKTGETWITYPGSTERNAVSEKEARSYNIITLSERGLEISKRTIPTRNFLSIRVELNGEDKPYEQIFSAVNEYLEEIPESVVFLEILGDSDIVLSQSELEEYLLNKGALVSKVTDDRNKESLPEEVLNVTFSDPDHAVASEVRRMSLNDGGLIIDEIVRSPNVSRSRVDGETEDRLSKLIEAKAADFRSPDFRIEIPASPDSSATTDGFTELENVKSDGEVLNAESIKPAAEIEYSEKAEFAGEAGFAGKTRHVGAIFGKLEITELSGILRTSDGNENPEKKSTKKNTEALKSIEISAASLDSPGLAPGSNSEQPSSSESEIKPEIKPEGKPEIKPEGKPEIKLEIKPESEIPENKPESEIPENKPQKEIQKLSELEVKGKPEKETPGKAGKQPEEKPARATELGKTGKAGQKKGKGKPAVPRQYNLGDYL